MRQKPSEQVDPSPQAISVELRREGDGQMVLRLTGRLEARTLPAIWAETVEPLRRAPPKRLMVDGSAIEYCDGAGLGLFAELRRVLAAAGGEVQVTGLAPDLKRLLDLSALEDPSARVLEPEPRPGFVSQVGRATAEILADIREIIEFAGEALAGLAWAAVHPRHVRYRDMWLVAEKAGVDGLPVVCLLGVLLGLISAFQAAIPLGKFGAQGWIPAMVAVGMTRELGPLMDSGQAVPKRAACSWVGKPQRKESTPL